jgi:hypothetical protein
MAGADNAQRRGYDLQDLLNRTFDLYEIPLHRSLMRNYGTEQIDGAFKLEAWHYLVECRWRKERTDTRQLDGILGQVDHSGKQTGVCSYRSMGGRSELAPLRSSRTQKISDLNGRL